VSGHQCMYVVCKTKVDEHMIVKIPCSKWDLSFQNFVNQFHFHPLFNLFKILDPFTQIDILKN
jgi:hypothetical protein